jgi:hypothetical protein
MRAVLSLIVMPRSRSMSLLSMNCSTMSRAATVPVFSSSWSARVDFPWSMWLRRRFGRVNGDVVGRQRRGRGAAWGRPRALRRGPGLSGIGPSRSGLPQAPLLMLAWQMHAQRTGATEGGRRMRRQHPLLGPGVLAAGRPRSHWADTNAPLQRCD